MGRSKLVKKVIPPLPNERTPLVNEVSRYTFLNLLDEKSLYRAAIGKVGGFGPFPDPCKPFLAEMGHSFLCANITHVTFGEV